MGLDVSDIVIEILKMWDPGVLGTDELAAEQSGEQRDSC
jgi:hypothetical protein